MLNRHGLIAGATGTGKTKTLQLLAGQLSKAGVPVFVADIKGDLTGLAAPGDATNPKVQERVDVARLDVRAGGPSGRVPVAVGQARRPGAGDRPLVRAAAAGQGARPQRDPDLDPGARSSSTATTTTCRCSTSRTSPTTLKYLASDEGKPILADYGGMSTASVGVLLRSIVVLEQEGADVFFGEPEFDVEDLLRTTPEGEGIVSILELSDVMDQPRLFSTFMLWMLAQLYESLPEVGDLPEAEAVLLLRRGAPAVRRRVARRSWTRSSGPPGSSARRASASTSSRRPRPTCPSPVLAQLGNRVQHALRAFTPDDADALRKTARTFPMTDFYDVEKTITSLGIGEALVTVLSPRGVPTPLAATRLLPPDSLMAPIDEVQFRGRIATSPFQAKYGATVDRDSAHERITARTRPRPGRRRRRPRCGPASTRRPRPG